MVPPPEAIGLQGEARAVSGLRFLHDDSWIDAAGKRQLSQTLFDHVFDTIARSRRLLLVDMFLFNDWQGPVPESHRALSAELANALITQKTAHPGMDIILISDPINTVYGGLQSAHFFALSQAGIQVVLTDLNRLQDSNPLWSAIWRLLIEPWGNSVGSALPNPFGEGRVSVRSYLALLNFKANHRKLLVADDNSGTLRGIVSSANPHDGSSAHRNVAISFTGPAALDLLAGERALLAMNGADAALAVVDQYLQEQESSGTAAATASASDRSSSTIEILSEARIHEAVIDALENAAEGDVVDLVMFYLSERRIIKALLAAHDRGADVRVLLDVNSDAFGREKNGVPNRPVAAELAKAGIKVRWCATVGEQCHAKWLHVQSGEQHVFLLGSANYTRRNLLDLNMETNARFSTTADDPAARQMIDFFDMQWNNRNGRTYTVTYDEFADDSPWLMLQYRFMEMTGLSTF